MRGSTPGTQESITPLLALPQVHGVEINPAAVLDAQRNAQRNGIGNTTFLQVGAAGGVRW